MLSEKSKPSADWYNDHIPVISDIRLQMREYKQPNPKKNIRATEVDP